MIYDKGDVARCSVEFRDPFANSALVDPDTVVCKVMTPALSTTTYTHGTDDALVKDSTGVYHIDVPCSAAGTWRYRFQGNGSYVAAEEGQFTVSAGSF